MLADWAVYGAPSTADDGTSVLREIAFDGTNMYFRADGRSIRSHARAGPRPQCTCSRVIWA
ncbi:MAG: hypothetical protein U0168_16160 [Nannocystaceae bacterium]